MSTTRSYSFTPQAPYRFDYFRQRVETSSNRYLYSITPERLSRAHILDGQTVLVHVTATEPTEPNGAPVILLDVQGAPSDAVAERAVGIWKHMLSLDRDLRPFYESIAHDPILSGIAERFDGMHLLLEADPFEAMILAIIGQQINLTFAENLKRALVELCDEKITVDGETHYAFPSPEMIARLDPADLRPLKFSQRKAEYVIDFARGVASGGIDLDALQHMSNEEAILSLSKLRGIGRWTAECVLLFGLGRPDLLPALDIGLRNAIQHFYGLEEQPTEQEVRDFARPWQGFESYATYYLWTALGVARAEQKAAQQARKTAGKQKKSSS